MTLATRKENSEKRFKLGNVFVTPGVQKQVEILDCLTALGRHHKGDWGTVCAEDWQANDEALEHGARLLSTYATSDGTKFWIITEADRSVTTLLLPEEY